MHWLRAASQSAVAERMGLSWDEIHGIMERAVKRGLELRKAERLPRLGVDEKAFRKGHKYFTLVNDIKRSRVLYVAEDRTQASLDGFWKTVSAEQLESIEAIAMDMWDSYLTSPRYGSVWRGLDGKIVFDKFHIAQHLGEAVDRVRRRENILTYLRHRITNAASESLKAKIQWVKYTARGYRNKRNFQTAIYFHWVT